MDWSATIIEDGGQYTDLSSAVLSYTFDPHHLTLTLATAPWLPVVAWGDVVEVTCHTEVGIVRQRFQIGWVERHAGDRVAHGHEVDVGKG